MKEKPLLMCLIRIVLISYLTIRQPVHTQHFIIVIQKRYMFWLRETEINKLRVSKIYIKNLFQCHLVQHKSQIYLPEIVVKPTSWLNKDRDKY